MAADHGDSLVISAKPLHPLFGAEIGKVEIGRPLDDSTFAEICAAFEEYSLLLLRDQELVMWDNRCLLHRATPFDTVRCKRLMQRTTVAGDASTVP